MSGASDTGTAYREYSMVVYFEESCGEENLKSAAVINNLSEIADIVHYHPNNFDNVCKSVEAIRNDGLRIKFLSAFSMEELQSFLARKICRNDISIGLRRLN